MVADDAGAVRVYGGDEVLRGKVLQVLFTTPGERVHQPEFGCGLLNLMFEPNGSILLAATQFTVGQALSRWLGDEIKIDLVRIDPSIQQDGYIVIELAYTKIQDLQQQAMIIQFK
ncbi:MAG: hypothetical protein GC149_14160 [Gammaproteobacteria bacterium]|nr:hypothetical protein [Gammaproteobacteria bacterium]